MKREKGLETFLSPDLDHFSNKNEVSNYLVKSGLKQESEKFKTLNSKETKSDQVHQSEWKADSSLPSGWNYRWTAVGDKSKFKHFKSPNGRIYQARSSAIKEMIE